MSKIKHMPLSGSRFTEGLQHTLNLGVNLLGLGKQHVRVKIALQPDTIEFFAITDGQSWTLIHAQPRKGFEGAPDILALGHGQDKDGAPEGYMFDSFFSDLVTAKL